MSRSTCRHSLSDESRGGRVHGSRRRRGYSAAQDSSTSQWATIGLRTAAARRIASSISSSDCTPRPSSENPATVGRQRRKVDQFAASALPHGDRGIGFDAHRGIAADQRQLLLEVLRRIGGRIQVGHRADRRIASVGRCGRTRGDGLLLRETRFAQVDMHVDQPRHEVPAAEIPRLSPGCGSQSAATRPCSTTRRPFSKRPPR